MNCSIYTSPEFEKTLKGLAKHYPSVKEDYRQFLSDLRKNPFMGTQLGNNLRKVRFQITSKGKGKSGGARVITHTVLISSEEANVTLLSIYDKSERNTISDKELKQLLKNNDLI